MQSLDNGRWPLRPRDQRLLRHGRPPQDGQLRSCAPKRNGYGEEIAGTAGYEDRDLVWTLVNAMVQQGWKLHHARRAMLDPSNAAGVWLRRQKDPEAELKRIFGLVDRGRRPHLPVCERQRRIISGLKRKKSMSQSEVVDCVGHANDGHVRGDLKDLEEAGVIRIAVEQHGKVAWKRIELVVSESEAHVAAATIRRALALKIAKRHAIMTAKVHRAFVRRAGWTKNERKSTTRAEVGSVSEWLWGPNSAQRLAIGDAENDLIEFARGLAGDPDPSVASMARAIAIPPPGAPEIGVVGRAFEFDMTDFWADFAEVMGWPAGYFDRTPTDPAATRDREVEEKKFLDSCIAEF